MHTVSADVFATPVCRTTEYVQWSTPHAARLFFEYADETFPILAGCVTDILQDRVDLDRNIFRLAEMIGFGTPKRQKMIISQSVSQSVSQSANQSASQ